MGLILAVETSCDDSSVAIVDESGKIYSNLVSSQIDIHRLYGGVVPEIASRNHLLKLNLLIEESLRKANKNISDIDYFAVTQGPGLVGALLVGHMVVKTLAFSFNKPILALNHMVSHVYANYIENDVQLPALVLVVSGGHTILFVLEETGDFILLGKTLDDAAGEAFDKAAKIMGKDYPGGPVIEKLGKTGNLKYKLPIGLNRKDNLDFSFSGVKTALLNLITNFQKNSKELPINDIAASFQEAVVSALVKKTQNALKQTKVKNLMLAGGVAANSLLRERLIDISKKNKINIYMPSKKYCTDNALMVAFHAIFKIKANKFNDLKFKAYSRMNWGKYVSKN